MGRAYSLLPGLIASKNLIRGVPRVAIQALEVIADVLVDNRVGVTEAQIFTLVERKVNNHGKAGVGSFDPFNFSLLEGYATGKYRVDFPHWRFAPQRRIRARPKWCCDESPVTGREQFSKFVERRQITGCPSVNFEFVSGDIEFDTLLT